MFIPPFSPHLWLSSSLNENISVQKNSLLAVYSEVSLLHGAATQPIPIKPTKGFFFSPKIPVFFRVSYFISTQWSHHSWAVTKLRGSFHVINFIMQFSRIFYSCWCLLKTLSFYPQPAKTSDFCFICVFLQRLSVTGAVGGCKAEVGCALGLLLPPFLCWHSISQHVFLGKSGVPEAVWFADHLWKVWVSDP